MSGDKPEDDFPILCETCLGPNPCIRMIREPWGKACSICERPFTMFRWKPGPKARYKCTEICSTCAKLKNVCQTCVLDLQFGLPVQVRDTALEEESKIKMPSSATNMQYLMEKHEAQVNLHGAMPYGKVDMNKLKTNSMLSRLRRSTPYYKRNAPHICSFFAKGTCNRGDLCPFRHEMPTTGPLAKQNTRDRYYGNNDPVALKMMGRLVDTAKLPEPPADRSITTIWVGGVNESITEAELRKVFFPYGELNAVRLVPHKFCAFVTFMRRDSAEEAIRSLYKDCKVGDAKLRLDWGRRQSKGVAPPPGMKAPAMVNNPDANKFLNAPNSSVPPPSSTIAPPPGMGAGRKPYYPSMDPKHMQSKVSDD